ncbi:type II CRISPR-associated endonuclease Cas1 [Auritidibacter ignavus]|uniref:type II CRISPR-associated endonuclease Cas1 n=1 Tax=Auritidibacter ignavus TaxID=678932 RepID=UPI00109D4590|nr:type II CRISPR-associated endonuclease Cas1 [Auritidibacter ignavus]
MAWQILDLQKYEGELSTKRGALVVGGSRVPLEQLNSVLVGPKVTFTASVVHHASKYGVSVIFCDWKGEPLAALNSWSSNFRAGARQRAQAALSEPRRKNAWMQIVKRKIESQARTLELADQNLACEELLQLSKQVRSGDPHNLEGQAARKYWQALYTGKNFTRVPGAADEINAAHNYGYTILRGRVLTALIAAGLNPSIAIFHRGRSNAFALADDLIEPFRALVDRHIWEIQGELFSFDADVKRGLVQLLKPDDTLEQGFRPGAAIDDFASAFAQYIEGESSILKVPRL